MSFYFPDNFNSAVIHADNTEILNTSGSMIYILLMIVLLIFILELSFYGSLVTPTEASRDWPLNATPAAHRSQEILRLPLIFKDTSTQFYFSTGAHKTI